MIEKVVGSVVRKMKNRATSGMLDHHHEEKMKVTREEDEKKE